MYRSIVFAVSLLALGTAACGGGNRDVKSPTTAVVAPEPVADVTPHAAPVEPTPLVVPAAEAPVQAKQGAAMKEEVTGEEATARAVAEMEAEANAAQLQKDKLKWEKLGRDAERKATDTDARDRLARSSARVAQAQTQLSRVPAQRRSKYNNDLVTFGTKKADVQARISSISSVGSDEWKRMRLELDRALDELDAAATRVEGDLF